MRDGAQVLPQTSNSREPLPVLARRGERRKQCDWKPVTSGAMEVGPSRLSCYQGMTQPFPEMQHQSKKGAGKEMPKLSPSPPPPTGPLAKLSKYGNPHDVSGLIGVIREPRAQRMHPGAGRGEGEQAKDSQPRQLKIVLTYRIVSELFQFDPPICRNF